MQHEITNADRVEFIARHVSSIEYWHDAEGCVRCSVHYVDRTGEELTVTSDPYPDPRRWLEAVTPPLMLCEAVDAVLDAWDEDDEQRRLEQKRIDADHAVAAVGHELARRKHMKGQEL